MIRRLTVFGMMLLAGVLGVTANPLAANEELVDVYEARFSPYFIGRQQLDNLIVVNHSEDALLRVRATAYDPFSGEELDVQRAEILPGMGERMAITETHPAPHASQLLVEVEIPIRPLSSVEADTLAGEIVPEPPFSLTRVLTTQRDETVLQVVGKPKLRETQDGK
jgi:hypothetical protein